MSSDTDFDAAFTLLLGKAVSVITQTGQLPITPPTSGGTTTSPVALGLEYLIDGGGSTITTGSFGGIILPLPMTFTAVELQEFDGITGSIQVDIRHGTPGNSPSFTSICGGNLPAITAGRHYIDNTLSGWFADLARGDALQFVVMSVSSLRRVTLLLYARRTDV